MERKNGEGDESGRGKIGLRGTKKRMAREGRRKGYVT